jgi:hypothetical protein
MKDFFAGLFEFWGNMTSAASDDLYEHAYNTVGWVLIFATLFSFVLYYYIINSSKFSQFLHWALVWIGNALAISVFAALFANGRFAASGLEWRIGDYTEFLIAVFLHSLLFFFILTLLLKRWSSACRYTPFKFPN